ncbi:MAG: hypothetical protein K9L74_05675 [Candidatus Izimaplasma sp.]|nr:hypothetical protein [Candidatus Izimaplasma bacterium]
MPKDDIALRILHGTSVEIPELDIEEQENIDVKALTKYEIYLLTESIGTNSFQDNYLLFKDNINNYDVDEQKLYGNRILTKLDEVYGFNFSEELNLNILEDRIFLDYFIQFLEFENIEFLTTLFRNLDVSLFKINLEQYLEDNSKEVIFTIQSLDIIYTYNKLILNFLTNYNSEDLIKWLIRQTNNNKIEVESNLKMEKEKIKWQK